MTRTRINAGELTRLLNAARQPIYVLDEDLTIVFLNRACHEWLDAAVDGLLGRRCAYHSQADGGTHGAAGPEAVAAGLCPPPEVLGAAALGATGVSPVSAAVCFRRPDGATVYRRARFIPLATVPGELIGLIAVVDTEDLTEPPAEEISPPPTEATSQQLHEHIRRFRWQAAGRYRVDRLLGHSPAMRRVRRQVELAVGSRSSVLLVGPPGSGRQHAAATIHYGTNAESAGSLVPLACSVLGAELIGSTIAALATAQPLGEGAGRSTLVLSDVDQLAPDVQAELAAMLIGRPFPLRLIATASQPLDELVRRGRFREDLAAALCTIVIELPPLTGRRGDIPLLAQALLEEINAQGTKQIGGLSSEALDRLDAYPWPGNVDELARAMAESHQRAGGPEIGAGDLPERLHLAAAAAAHPRRKDETIVLDEFLGRMERELIRRALARAKGNKAKAARLLGLTRPRLYRRMVQLGLAAE